LPRLGIKVGILGLRRLDFDLILTPMTSEHDQAVIEDVPVEEDEVSFLIVIILADRSNFYYFKINMFFSLYDFPIYDIVTLYFTN
jgi:hypothetical protein